MFARIRRLAAAAALALLLLAAGPPAGARAARSWSVSTAEEFSRGRLEGTALDEEGRVRLAFGLETLWGPGEGVVWDVRPTGERDTFVALSAPGRVLRVGANGAAEVWYEGGGDSLVAALAPDGKGGVYFGLSPAGQLLHAAVPGKAEVVGETGASFIWALAAADDGSIWVGTGIPGRLLRFSLEGQLETVFETGDDPVRCLSSLEGGGVILGTGGHGRVIRFDAQLRPFVLFDADEPEVVDLTPGPDGMVFVLVARGSKQARAAPQAAAMADETVRVVAAAPSGDEDEVVEVVEPEGPRRPTPPRRSSTPQGAVLYRVSADGGGQPIWSSQRETPFALARTTDRHLLVATGDLGRIHRLDERGRESMLLEIPSEQASALAPTSDGGVLVGGTTNARLVLLGSDALDRGIYLTEAFDAGGVAEWGRMTWEAELPRGAEVRVLVRAGNTDDPDTTWTEWIEIVGRRAAAAEPRLPPSRWFQARVELEASRAGESPLLRSLELFFLARNRAPRIESVTVQPAGVVWSQVLVQSARPRGPVVADDPVSRKAVQSLEGHGSKSIRKSFELGVRTATWKAEDPDGDTLTYTVEVRHEGGTAWLPLVVDIEDDFVSWDSRGLSDGLYRLRLTAEDSRDNADGKQFSDRQESAVFQVDNTRPSVQPPQIRSIAEGFEVEFVAADPGGNVAAVEAAVDGGAWQLLDPLDGVADSAEESYRMRVEPGQGSISPRSIHLRVTDTSGNLGGDAWPLGSAPE